MPRRRGPCRAMARGPVLSRHSERRHELQAAGQNRHAWSVHGLPPPCGERWVATTKGSVAPVYYAAARASSTRCSTRSSRSFSSTVMTPVAPSTCARPKNRRPSVGGRLGATGRFPTSATPGEAGRAALRPRSVGAARRVRSPPARRGRGAAPEDGSTGLRGRAIAPCGSELRLRFRADCWADVRRRLDRCTHYGRVRPEERSRPDRGSDAASFVTGTTSGGRRARDGVSVNRAGI